MHFDYSLLYKAAYFMVLMPTVLIIVSAAASAKQMGGTLGEGMKKIAAGTIIHTIMIVAFILQEIGFQGVLNAAYIQLFFLVSSILGAIFLILGYLQIYRISKKLKLFTL